MSTVQETLQEITEHQHRRRVLAEMADHLSKNFLGDSAQTMEVKDCPSPQVSHKTIEGMVSELIEEMDTLEETIEEPNERGVKS